MLLVTFVSRTHAPGGDIGPNDGGVHKRSLVIGEISQFGYITVLRDSESFCVD